VGKAENEVSLPGDDENEREVRQGVACIAMLCTGSFPDVTNWQALSGS